MSKQIDLDGQAARAVVRARHPEATSAYVGGSSAEVYVDRIGGSYEKLGEATAIEDSVELAWIDAANRLAQEDNSEAAS